MKRTIRIKWGELKVGLIITFAIAILLWASFVGGGTSIFDRKASYKAYFANVNGLVKGSPVWISGVEVGNVTGIDFVNLDSARQIEIGFRVKKSVTNMMTTDAAVKLGTIGFLGDKYIEVIPGTLTNPPLEEGSVVRTVSAGDLSAMFAEGEKTMGSTRKLAENLSDITSKLKLGEGTAGQLFTNDTLYHELTKLVTSLTILVNEMQSSQKRLVASIENVATNLDTITSQINSNQGTLGKLISDPQLYDNMRSSSARIDSILAKLNRGDGTAGAMINDDSLYQELTTVMTRVENLLTDISKNPKKYFKFSVF